MTRYKAAGTTFPLTVWFTLPSSGDICELHLAQCILNTIIFFSHKGCYRMVNHVRNIHFNTFQ